MNKKSLTFSPNYDQIRAQINDLIENVISETNALETLDEHSAFNYLIAGIFETVDEKSFTYTDGKNDGGIDFYISEEASYSVYQCKFPELDNIEAKCSPITFDRKPIEELISGIDTLLDKEGKYELNSGVKRLRSDFHRDDRTDSDGTSLMGVVAIFGELTTPAQTFFEEKKKQLKAEKNIVLKLLDWKEIQKRLHSWSEPEDVDVKIQIGYKKGDILRRHDYLYVLARAFDFYSAFDQYEWNLFDWNVRLQLKNSSINKKIVKSLEHQKTRKSFHHYNNGLLITCKSYGINQNKNIITANGAQVINGCQTISAIRQAYENLSPKGQEQFREETLVQTKIIKTTNPEFMGELVISTNNQNPMKARNLRSNLAEQKVIQSHFDGLSPAWFYERKDGEFTSLLSASSKVRWFKPSRYHVSKKKIPQNR